MAEVIPFKGICFNPEKIEAASVMAPPYDIISPEMREALYEKSPYNIVRIDAGKEMSGDSPAHNKYTRAEETLNRWLREGILQIDEKPCFYAYRVDYEIEGEKRRMRGFFGLLRLEPLGQGQVYPHECTHSKARTDRLSLLMATKANTSPILSIYDNPEKNASRVFDRLEDAAARPRFEATDHDGFSHRLWIIDDPADIGLLEADLRENPVFIADGHHRYETALENQRLMKEQTGSGRGLFDYVLAFFANVADGGITVLPTHRLLKGLPDVPGCLTPYFELEELDRSQDILKKIKGMKNTFGLIEDGRAHRVSCRQGNLPLEDIHPVLRGLDVVILHELILKRLAHTEEFYYEMDASAARALVENGTYGAAFLLNPTSVREVVEVALSGQRMPPKSTYFYPKLLTGFVLSRF